MRYCLVLPSWTREDLTRHSCQSRNHCHISAIERDELVIDGNAEIICSLCGWAGPDCTCARPSFRIVRLNRVAAIHGFSCRFGEFISKIRFTEFGRLLVSEMTLRPMEGD